MFRFKGLHQQRLSAALTTNEDSAPAKPKPDVRSSMKQHRQIHMQISSQPNAGRDWFPAHFTLVTASSSLLWQRNGCTRLQ
jgi:hypothetical protein